MGNHNPTTTPSKITKLSPFCLVALKCRGRRIKKKEKKDEDEYNELFSEKDGVEREKNVDGMEVQIVWIFC